MLLAFGSVAAYMPCDKLADDYVGDTIEGYLQIPPEPPKHRARHKDFNGTSVGHALALVDDLVEDGFKLGCLASHRDVTQALVSTYVPLSVTAPFVDSIFPPAARPGLHSAAMGMVWMVKQLVALSVPLKQYKKCDEYGDNLGDWVQESLASLWAEGISAMWK